MKKGNKFHFLLMSIWAIFFELLNRIIGTKMVTFLKYIRILFTQKCDTKMCHPFPRDIEQKLEINFERLRAILYSSESAVKIKALQKVKNCSKVKLS